MAERNDMKKSKLKTRDVLWLIYELLIYPGYLIFGWAILLDYIVIPYNYFLEFLIIIFLFPQPGFVKLGIFGSKPKKRLEELLKLTI